MSPPYDETLDDGLGDDAEVLDGEVVEEHDGRPADTVRTPPRPPSPGAAPSSSPARRTAGVEAVRSLPVAAQAVAMAATGFAAGAVATAVVRKVARRQTVKSRRGKTPTLPIVGTRSFVVDVHLLAPRRD